jgi:quercetin dioxygenase-like cupin family protein
MAIGVTTPEEAKTVWVLGDQLRFMGGIHGGTLHAIEVTVPPGSGTPPHRHASIEIFHVMEGEVTFHEFGEGAPRQAVAGPGTVVTVPSGAAHNYTNAGDRTARMLVVLEQQMIDFFRDIGAPQAPPPGAPSAEAISRLMDACNRHGVEILGGPPPG